MVVIVLASTFNHVKNTFFQLEEELLRVFKKYFANMSVTLEKLNRFKLISSPAHNQSTSINGFSSKVVNAVKLLQSHVVDPP